MKPIPRCIPLGALPYDDISSATRMVAKLFPENPSLVLLPLIDNEDTLIKRTLDKIPTIEFTKTGLSIKPATKESAKDIAKLDKAFNNPSLDKLEPFAIESVFIEKFFQIIKKFNSPYAYINLLGPFSISQVLLNAAKEQMLTDKTFRKLFIQSVCVKALWAIEKIKEISPNTTPIIILEEPEYGKLGNIKRENEDITVDLVTNLFARTVEKIKSSGAIVAIQCLEKCDWKIPINAGVDIISYDAYNNPNNLCIIPEQITLYLRQGGKINWGIVPVLNESMVKSLNISFIEQRLKATMEGLTLAGVPNSLVENSAYVSIQGNVDNLPLIFAEKAIILSTQLGKKLSLRNDIST